MSDGLVLIHAFPLDARMWEGQRFGPHTVAPGPARVRHGGRGERYHDDDGGGRRAMPRGRGRGGPRPIRRVRTVDGRVRRVRAVA